MILNENYTLNNGVEIPKLGLGTWLIDDDKVADVVKKAIELGYRHIDTAEAYGDEHGVGKGVLTSGVTRDKIFVTTKLAAEIKPYDKAIEAIDNSLVTSGLDYFDLMLIHSPEPWNDFRGGDYAEGNREAWRALEDAYKQGKLRAIGISNFREKDIDSIMETCSIKPMVNQLLTHISNTPTDLIEYSKEKGMLVEAYSPVAHGEILNNPIIKKMADKYSVTVAQLCIRYCSEIETLPLPKTSNIEHMKENAMVDFEISSADMKTLLEIEHIHDYGEHSFFPVFSGK